MNFHQCGKYVYKSRWEIPSEIPNTNKNMPINKPLIILSPFVYSHTYHHVTCPRFLYIVISSNLIYHISCYSIITCYLQKKKISDSFKIYCILKMSNITRNINRRHGPALHKFLYWWRKQINANELYMKYNQRSFIHITVKFLENLDKFN